MTKFAHPFENPGYFEKAEKLYHKYLRFLEDDYTDCDFKNLVERTLPYFWVITEGDTASGFVYLDNIIGDGCRYHSAELVTCFDRAYWGIYTKICAYVFLYMIFQTYGFEKIKALVYPDNFRVKTLLTYAGFKKEALLKRETLRGGKFQDIEVYSVFKEFYEREPFSVV